MKNTIKLLDALCDKDGYMTGLYQVSKPKHYSLYVLSIISKGEDQISRYSITDIRGVCLTESTSDLETCKFLENYKLDKK